MQRNLRIERLFTLGDYKNIKVYDEIEDIPEELLTNKEVIDSLYLLMLLNVDRVYAKYKTLIEHTSKYTNLDDIIIELDNLREAILSNLNELLINGKEK
jgi:hypothetical protein